MGCLNFFFQMNPEMVASYRASEQAIIQGRPLWATIGFAVAVFGGAVGSILLILKKPLAMQTFCVSMVGVFVAVAHSLTVDIHFSAGELVGIIIMPIVVGAFFIWYSWIIKNKE